MAEQHLLIFTRWPEPGKTKTRLIPALGPGGAAQLQQQLTEYTVHTANIFRQQTLIKSQVTIFYTGGPEPQMKQWLGNDLTYQSQSSGDLGDRLQKSCQWALGQGSQKVVIIGIDCPGVTPELLQTAFTALDNCSVVLGPALDGGYYLIGLNKFNPAYFEQIDWGTERVYQQTLAKIVQNGDRPYNLPALPDIDHPTDLQYLPTAFTDTTPT
ncbi:TIGR04282 family arsenosugar biosynthesis glycosyltransferase [Synechocystis sp. FACHB-383]|uniref:TIGR04282 family arsenosugar biosynthesis glycosyltransferase n=1 Tax=Synechocystis sp. FACHB-383 TaxID=2692864 RepID=UPI001686849F|nr:TIGR04282 family arsenosugar biosynthesis glycosyltransferase [Synechocystis sp. FACHB-383]MBD2652222.1 TIGR04282 family arsenosugar biosynthesis glycosyltransferase [Synechocystis sp. FACHB-383]